MREHRFRIWDSMKKKMITESFENYRKYGFGIGLDGKAYKMDDDGGCGDPACCGGRDFYMTEIPHLEIMQFTGLYDKDKTPIYAGDIVRIFEHEFSPMDFLVEYSEINYCWWLSSVAKSVQYGVSQQMFSFSNLHGFEHDSIVIGDKFSNPELLQKDLKS